MFWAAGLVGVAGNLDGAVEGRGLAIDEPLRIEGASAATAIGQALGDGASEGVDEPGEIEHFAEGIGAEVEVETGDEYVMAGFKQIFDEEEEGVDELTLVDGDALDTLANLLLFLGDDGQNLPGIGGIEGVCLHLAVAEGVAALNQARTALGVVAGLEEQDVLVSILTANIGTAQQFGGFVRAHGPHHQFEFARQLCTFT